MKKTGKQCDPQGASPSHNRMLEENGVPPEAVEDCDAEKGDEAPRAFPQRDPAKKKTGRI